MQQSFQVCHPGLAKAVLQVSGLLLRMQHLPIIKHVCLGLTSLLPTPADQVTCEGTKEALLDSPAG